MLVRRTCHHSRESWHCTCSRLTHSVGCVMIKMAPVAAVPTHVFDAVDAYELSKRLFDLTFAVVSIVILSPLFVVVTLFIFVGDRGSPFFAQIRVGKDGREFM